MESEAELVAKWERIHAEHEDYVQRCRQREEALSTIDNKLKDGETKADILHNKLHGESPMIVDYALDLLGDVLRFNDFCATALGIEIVLDPREPRPRET